MASMKKAEPDPADFHEGPEAAKRFDRLFRQVVSAPKSQVEKLENRERAKNLKRREKRRKVA